MSVMDANSHQHQLITAPRWRFNFSILGLMAATTLVAVEMCLLVYLPYAGIPLVLLSVAPLVRTYLAVRRARFGGTPLWAVDVALFTLASAAVLPAAMIAAEVTYICVLLILGGSTE